MQFITTDNRIAVENFQIGYFYTITFNNHNYIITTCTGKGDNFVSFLCSEPELVFDLTMQTADSIATIELYGGGTGTTDYNNLSNKPTINNVLLVGNKTTSDLLINDVPVVTSADDNKVLISTYSGGVGSYSWEAYSPISSYTELNDKPTINSVTLTGNKTSSDLGIQPEINSENPLFSDNVTDTDQTNKFATAAQLAQITTNQNNILSLDDYTKSLYKTQIDTVTQKVIADKDLHTVTIALMTDIHSRSTFDITPEMILFNDVAEKSGVDLIINMGDLTYGSTPYCNKFWEFANKSYLPMLFTIGNHDVDQTTICYANEKSHINYLSGVTFSSDMANWYVDIGDVRLVGLDSQNGFTNDTVTWLSTMLSTCTKKIAVFTHKPCRKGLNWGNILITNANELLAVLQGYSYDILGYFYGHTHCDNIFKSGSDDFPFINLCCALAVEATGEDIPKTGNAVAYPRVVGTYSEFCFDIVNLHTDTNSVKMFRFGVGNDRVYPTP